MKKEFVSQYNKKNAVCIPNVESEIVQLMKENLKLQNIIAKI
jgi:hypothetical protein